MIPRLLPVGRIFRSELWVTQSSNVRRRRIQQSILEGARSETSQNSDEKHVSKRSDLAVSDSCSLGIDSWI